MHEHLSALLLWQSLAQRNAVRQYQGGVMRRGMLIGRITGRVLYVVGYHLTALGDWLQGDVIPVPSGKTQPAEH